MEMKNHFVIRMDNSTGRNSVDLNYEVGPHLEGDSENAGAMSRRKELHSDFLRAPKLQVSTKEPRSL